MARVILHVDLDAFFVAVEQSLNPELKGKPVIVGGDPDGRGVVTSASYEARPAGIHAGMPLSRALRLCPQAIFVRANFPRYRDASHRFLNILGGFSPCVEPLGLDEAYLDITGYEQPYGSYRQMALALKQKVREDLDLTASVGIATCKVVAKIASELCKPDGLLEIAPGEERAFLGPLPVSRLPGVGKKTEQSLSGMGITTIGELAAVPLDAVERRLGAPGAVLHSHARGIDSRPVEAPGEANSISQELTFARDTLDRSFLEDNLHSLCQEVCRQLRSRDRRARCVAIRLRYADFETITRQVTLEEASDITAVIFAAAQQLLARTVAQQRKPVRLIGVRVSGFVGGERQLRLFDFGNEKLEHLDEAVDRIARKHGKTAIRTGDSLSLDSGQNAR
jgi:DNA polymerase IV